MRTALLSAHSRHISRVSARCAADSQQQRLQQLQTRIPKPPKASQPPSNLADKPGSPFHELGLKELGDGLGRTRVRQHVNPLAARYQRPTPAVDWAQVYDDPSLPLFVDMGCGPGRFLLLLARHHGRQGAAMNYLGLEIRQPLVERANTWAGELGLTRRVHFLFTNVSVSLVGLLSNYPGPVTSLAAQFPDPLFKRRHRKRRMVQASVVDAARHLLVPGGTIFLQSVIWQAVTAMRDEFEQHAGDVLSLSPLHTSGRVFHWTREQEAAAVAAVVAQQAQQAAPAPAAQQEQAGAEQQQQQGLAAAVAAVQDGAAGADEGSSGDGADDEGEPEGFVSTWAAGGWLADNPLGVPTEREVYVTEQGGKVFRVVLVKQAGAPQC